MPPKAAVQAEASMKRMHITAKCLRAQQKGGGLTNRGSILMSLTHLQAS